MRTEHFEYFAAVAKEGSFSKAAKKLYLSEPTLNKNITSFETELGFKLFSRSKRQLVLTPEGTAFLPLAAKVTGTINESIAAIKQLTSKNNSTLKVNHVALDSDPIFDDVVKCLKRKSDISIIVYEADPKNYRERLLGDFHDTDVEITILTDSMAIPSTLESKDMKSLIETVIVSNDHPLASKNAVSFADLDGERLVFSCQQPNEAHLQLIRDVESCTEYVISYMFVNSISSGLRLVERDGCMMVKTSLYDVPEGFVAIPLVTNFKPRLTALWSKANARESLARFLQTLDKVQAEYA